MSNSASAPDPFKLERFVTAQQSVISAVFAELQQGRKLTHWMWFIFPQLKGLGRSRDAEYYGIASPEEARSYLQHAQLGPTLLKCTRIVNDIQNRSIQQMFGAVDSLKFRSCMTLFSEADKTQRPFTRALEKYFEGQPDPLTLHLLQKSN